MSSGRASVRITGGVKFQDWVSGFGSMPSRLMDKATEEWLASGDVFYGATQERVHVLSGDLLASGRVDVYQENAAEVVMELSYGNGDVVYAQFEHARGGSHAFLTRGWEQSEEVFASALGRAWSSALKPWI